MPASGAIKKTFVAYINGYKMWPRSINVTAAIGGLLDFSLEFPAIEQWDILPARSHCVIFFIDPVTKKWRMLCEGEYTGYSKSRASTGSRTRYLTFRGLHGTLSSSTYVSYAGIASNDTVRNAQILASGRRIAPTENVKVDVFALDQLIDSITSSGRISALFNNLIRSVLMQLPVEGFYLFYRKLMQKTFAFKDDQATAVLRVERFKQITKLMASARAHDNKTLAMILREFESVVMYQHYPVLCPPLHRPASQTSGEDVLTPPPGASRIPEIVFSPALYSVVPPACNVFFEDQMTTQSSQRNFVSEPTRIILQIQSGQIVIPNIYMANSLDEAVDISQLANTENYVGENPGSIVAGINLSQEEMLRGVVPQVRPLNFEKLAREASKTEAQSEGAITKRLTEEQYVLYCTLATRHHYAQARGEHRPGSVVCAFHPYAVAGAPALIEDRGGSFHCIIQAVTHTLSNDSPPFTTLTVSHVRAAQVIEGRNETPPNPSWLNDYYLPRRIAGEINPEDESGSGGTWGKLFGPNAWQERDGTYRTAMVTNKEIIDDLNAGTNTYNDEIDGTKINADEQVNMDRLAAKVMPVPQYDDELNFLKKSTNTVADHLRRQVDVPQAMMRFNYRPGVSISEFVKFHGLSAKITSEVDRVLPDQLPDTLAVLGEGNGHPLFGSPVRMEYIQSGEPADESRVRPDENIYGIYQIIPEAGSGRTISRIRQQAARTIQQALNRIITKG